MTDATPDALPRGLAYLHPAWMVASLALAGLALRFGLVLRRSRRAGGRRSAAARRAHLRLAKPAVVLLLVGLLGGPVSAVWLRDWEPLHSFHGAAGLLTGLLFAAAALLGHRIEAGRGRAYDAHALLGMLALLVAAVAAVAGFILLP